MSAFPEKKSRTADPWYLPTGQEEQLFETAWRVQRPILLKGPTGCGKTRFVEHMAARLQLPQVTVACHDDLSAADLVGRHLINKEGTYWVDGPLTQAVRQGGICYLDEVIEARKDTTVILHALTDDRRTLFIDRIGETLVAPAAFMLVISYNPGYQHALKGLKPSTRQRFIALSFNFPPPEKEAEIIHVETGLDLQRAGRLVQLGQALRRNAQQDIEEPPGTRLLVAAADLMQQGCSASLACRSAILESLSDDSETLDALMTVVAALFGHAESA